MAMYVQLYRFKRSEISKHIVTSRERCKPIRPHSQGHHNQSFQDPDWGDWSSISQPIGEGQRSMSLAYEQITLGVGAHLATSTWQVLTKERFEDLLEISTEVPLIRAIENFQESLEETPQHKPLYEQSEIDDYYKLLDLLKKSVDWDKEIVAAIMT